MRRSALEGAIARVLRSTTACGALAVVACLLALPGAVYANPRTTAEVLQHHLGAFCPDDPSDPVDLDHFMEDYHNRAVGITGDNTGAPPVVASGAENIRETFAGLFAAVGNGCDLVLQQQVVDGQYAYVQWLWPELGGLVPGFDAWGSDTFVVTGGQIRLQTAYIVLVPSAP